MKSYRDAILPIAEIYCSNGFITEKDISSVMYKLDIPFSEVSFIFDILDKFGIQIQESIGQTDTSDSCGNTTLVSSGFENKNEVSEFVENSVVVSDVLYFSTSGCSGKGQMLSQKEFILFKGARLSKKIYESGKNEIIIMRSQYENMIDNHETIQDILFKSATGAAKFICGYSINGKIAWKNKQGLTLKQLLSK